MARFFIQLFALLLLAAVVVKLLPWLAAGVLLWLGAQGLSKWWGREYARREARRVEVAGLRRRADEQQAWRMRGDPRGWYGEFPPAV